MQVSQFVKEAIDEVALYGSLEYKPLIASGAVAVASRSGAASAAAFEPAGDACSRPLPPASLEAFKRTLDWSFFNVFNQPCGYYQLKRFAVRDEALRLSLLEDLGEYRLTDDLQLRLQRARMIVLSYSSSAALLRSSADGGGGGGGGPASSAALGESYTSKRSWGDSTFSAASGSSRGGGEGDVLATERFLAGSGGSSSSDASPPSLLPAGVMSASATSVAFARAALHTNGVQCLALHFQRDSGAALPSPRDLWASVKRELASEHAPVGLFDGLMASNLAVVEASLFPSFVHSQCADIYAQMLAFAFARAPLTKRQFVWLRPLGRGGYGMVYAAQRKDSGKLYAVKCMDKRMVKLRHATRMIVNERDILATVDSSFITGLQYAFQDDAEVFFVLDLKTGGDLEHFLLNSAHAFTEVQVRFIIAEIVLGIKYLHERGIMHRDIKPANILMDQDGHVSISDLGLAVFFAPPAPASKGGGEAAAATAAAAGGGGGEDGKAPSASAAAATSGLIPNTTSTSIAGGSKSIPSQDGGADAGGGAPDEAAAAISLLAALLAGAVPLPGTPKAIVGPLYPGMPTMILSPFQTSSHSPSLVTPTLLSPAASTPSSASAASLSSTFTPPTLQRPSSRVLWSSAAPPNVVVLARATVISADNSASPMTPALCSPVLRAAGGSLDSSFPAAASAIPPAKERTPSNPAASAAPLTAAAAVATAHLVSVTPRPELLLREKGGGGGAILPLAAAAAAAVRPPMHEHPLHSSGSIGAASSAATLLSPPPPPPPPPPSRETSLNRSASAAALLMTAHLHAAPIAALRGASTTMAPLPEKALPSLLPVYNVFVNFTNSVGVGVSACDGAGYKFGGAAGEFGVRGKAGTPGFWAPEMLSYEKDGRGSRYGPAVDWWSLGCLAYALLSARGPFTVVGGDTADDNSATLNNAPDCSNSSLFSPDAASFIAGLLQKDPKQRLGSSEAGSGIEDVMSHPFFAGINWTALEQKQLPPPFRPTASVLQSTKAVRGWSEKDHAKLQPVTLNEAEQARYKGIPFVSQKASYKEIIQNMALREYVDETLAAAAAVATAAPPPAAASKTNGASPLATSEAAASTASTPAPLATILQRTSPSPGGPGPFPAGAGSSAPASSLFRGAGPPATITSNSSALSSRSLGGGTARLNATSSIQPPPPRFQASAIARSVSGGAVLASSTPFSAASAAMPSPSMATGAPLLSSSFFLPSSKGGARQMQVATHSTPASFVALSSSAPASSVGGGSQAKALAAGARYPQRATASGAAGTPGKCIVH